MLVGCPHEIPVVLREHTSVFVLVLPLVQLPPVQIICVTVCVRVPLSSHVFEKPPHALQLPVTVPAPHDCPWVLREHALVSVMLVVLHEPPEQALVDTERASVPFCAHSEP
jgi:hypothetical protein